MKIAVWALKMLTALFGQDKIWEAWQEIAERRTEIKLGKFEERKPVREAKVENKAERLQHKGEKRKSRRKKDKE